MKLSPGPKSIELLSTKSCLAWHFFIDKKRDYQPNFYLLHVTSYTCTCMQLLFACPENHVEIWLVFLFLSREKCHARQIVVLSSSMKLGPGLERKPLWSRILLGRSLNHLDKFVEILFLVSLEHEPLWRRYYMYLSRAVSHELSKRWSFATKSYRRNFAPCEMNPGDKIATYPRYKQPGSRLPQKKLHPCRRDQLCETAHALRQWRKPRELGNRTVQILMFTAQ